MNDVKAGDLVQLKSGGPKMTIKHLDQYGSFYYQWFAGTKVEGATFEATSLIKIS